MCMYNTSEFRFDYFGLYRDCLKHKAALDDILIIVVRRKERCLEITYLMSDDRPTKAHSNDFIIIILTLTNREYSLAEVVM